MLRAGSGRGHHSDGHESLEEEDEDEDEDEEEDSGGRAGGGGSIQASVYEGRGKKGRALADRNGLKEMERWRRRQRRARGQEGLSEDFSGEEEGNEDEDDEEDEEEDLSAEDRNGAYPANEQDEEEDEEEEDEEEEADRSLRSEDEMQEVEDLFALGSGARDLSQFLSRSLGYSVSPPPPAMRPLAPRRGSKRGNAGKKASARRRDLPSKLALGSRSSSPPSSLDSGSDESGRGEGGRFTFGSSGSLAWQAALGVLFEEGPSFKGHKREARGQPGFARERDGRVDAVAGRGHGADMVTQPPAARQGSPRRRLAVHTTLYVRTYADVALFNPQLALEYNYTGQAQQACLSNSLG